MRIYATGAYGTGNLGDDAIFNGLKNYYADDEVIQIYVNLPSAENSIWYANILANGFPVNENAKLLIGGGGLFFSKQTIRDLIHLASHAAQANMLVEIQRIGTEGADPSYYEDIKELCSYCSEITVRTYKSKEILSTEIGVAQKIVVQPDFAYQIRPDLLGAQKIMPFFQNDYPVIGIATACQPDPGTISYLTRHLTLRGYNILHIPHARHYVDIKNNDMISGELIYSGIDIYCQNRNLQYQTLPFPSSPEQLLGVYTMLDAVIGQRFHSFIFADSAQIPLYGLVSSRKARAFFEDHPSYVYSQSQSQEEILKSVMEFLSTIRSKQHVRL